MSDMPRRHLTGAIRAAVAVLVLLPAPALAQLNGTNLKGDAGLKSGSQPPPGAYVAIPLWLYSADQIKDRDGDELRTGSLDATIFGAALNVVTTKKLLGANYGFVADCPGRTTACRGSRTSTPIRAPG